MDDVVINYDDKKNELIQLLERANSESASNNLRMFFVKKPSAEKMQVFQPQVSTDIQNEISKLILPNTISSLRNAVLSGYNPVGVPDGQMEHISDDIVPQVQLFLKAISDDEIFKDMKLLSVGHIKYYCLCYSCNGKTIYLLRQFSKMKKLRSGYIARIVNDELVAMDGDFLGIDENIDIILYENTLFVLNHISLERIFNYRDEYLKKTNEALGEILNTGCIKNMEQFSEDCTSDVRIMKRFTNIMTQGRLPLFFQNFDKVPGIVQELGLDIEYDEDEGKLVYREKSQLFHIINLMSDAYFKSLLLDRTGIAIIEETIS